MVMGVMKCEKLKEGLYEVQSRSSTARSYFVQDGKEGPWWSCTCPRWAITRNKAGGLGFQGACAHVNEINRLETRNNAEDEMVRGLQALRAKL